MAKTRNRSSSNQHAAYESTPIFAAFKAVAFKIKHINHHLLCEELTSEMGCEDYQTTKHEAYCLKGCVMVIDPASCHEERIPQNARSVEDSKRS